MPRPVTGSAFLQAEVECRHRYHKSGQRTGDADVEYGAPALDQRLDLNERSQRAETHRYWDEVRPGHIHAMPARHDEMPHLVDAENSNQRRGVGQARGEL
jgi:hypothetical protein